MTTRPAWSDAADEIFASDQAVGFAYTTPARGVVLTPLTNFAIRDRAHGEMEPLNSSIGMWRKLEQIERRPKVAVAYHTREHGFSRRPEYVLVQARASPRPLDDRTWIARNREAWDRFAGPRDVGPLWERWLELYHWRVGIRLDVERVLVYPDLACAGVPEVYGAPLPAEPPAPQRAPKNGTAPRVNHRRAAAHARRLPNVLLGWVGGDGYPMVVPVRVGEVRPEGVELEPARPDLVPPGGRRAGFLAHRFARYTYGQDQLRHTGWLDAGAKPGRVVYAPHTKGGWYLPWSRTAYLLLAGIGTRRGYRAGRRAGFLPG